MDSSRVLNVKTNHLSVSNRIFFVRGLFKVDMCLKHKMDCQIFSQTMKIGAKRMTRMGWDGATKKKSKLVIMGMHSFSVCLHDQRSFTESS